MGPPPQAPFCPGHPPRAACPLQAAATSDNLQPEGPAWEVWGGHTRGTCLFTPPWLCPPCHLQSARGCTCCPHAWRARQLPSHLLADQGQAARASPCERHTVPGWLLSSLPTFPNSHPALPCTYHSALHPPSWGMTLQLPSLRRRLTNPTRPPSLSDPLHLAPCPHSSAILSQMAGFPQSDG